MVVSVALHLTECSIFNNYCRNTLKTLNSKAHTRCCRWCIACKSLPTTRSEYLLNCMTAIHLVRLIWIVCTGFVCIVSCYVLSDDLFPIFAFVSHFNNKPFNDDEDDNNNTQLSWFCSLLFHWVFSCCLVKFNCGTA